MTHSSAGRTISFLKVSNAGLKRLTSTSQKTRYTQAYGSGKSTKQGPYTP